MSAPALELIGFSKRFGPLAALDDVSVKIQAGAFHALPSGSTTSPGPSTGCA